MAWNHDDVSPNRSRDELLGDVVRRGERIRHRRRLAGGLGGGVAVLLAVAGVAAVVGTGGSPSTQLAAGGRATTTMPVPAVGGTTFALVAPSTTADPVSPVSTVAPTATTAYVPGESDSDSGAAATTTTVAPPAVAENARCGPGVLQATLTLAPAYAAGQPVSGQAVLRNVSGAPCYYASYTNSQEITDAGGNPLVPSSALIADAFQDTPFAPGQTLTTPVDWDQKSCLVNPACPQVPAGTYQAKVSWSFDGPPVDAVATFTIS